MKKDDPQFGHEALAALNAQVAAGNLFLGSPPPRQKNAPLTLFYCPLYAKGQAVALLEGLGITFNRDVRGVESAEVCVHKPSLFMQIGQDSYNTVGQQLLARAAGAAPQPSPASAPPRGR